MRRASKPPQADPIPSSDLSARSRTKSPIAPLFVWLLLQLLASGLSAGRIPFYAMKSFPQPAELLAIPLMMGVQIGASAILFPFLFRDARAAVLVIAASWPFTVLAGFLSGFPLKLPTIASLGFVTIWLAGLALWRKPLRSPRAQAVGVSAATLFAFGGPVITYLGLEYGASSAAGIDGPISAAITISTRDPLSRPIWIYAGAYLILACIAYGFSRFRRYPSL